MGRLGHFFAGLITVLVLDVLMFGLFVTVSGVPARWVLTAGPKEWAARDAFARDVRGIPGEVGSFTLLNRPVPVGAHLCSVRALAMGPNGGGGVVPGEEVHVIHLLVVRRLRDEPTQTPKQAYDDCARRTDFSHSIDGDAKEIDWMLSDLESLQALARAGALRVTPDCLEIRREGDRSCDTQAVLASLDLRGLFKVDSLGDTKDAHLRLGKSACGPPDLVSMRIVKRGDPDRFAAVRVRVDGGC